MDQFYDFTNCRKSLKQYGGSDRKESVIMNGERYMLKFPDRISAEKRNKLNATYRNNIY